MLSLPPAVRIFVAPAPTNMHLSFDRLAALARDVCQQDPLSGHLFCFFNRTADRVKILCWDRSGFCLWYKRLERGVFHLPRAGAAHLELEAAELLLLLDTKASDPARALPALGFIQQLYIVEREVKGAEAEIRRARRAEQAVPVLTRFRQWLDAQADIVLPKSPIGEAVGYARAQWTALTRYTEDGDLAIDNNVSERALRQVVTGRTNWTFCGSDAGGRRAAILYSLVATCKAHGLDPWAYLRAVLERIPPHPNRRRAELLPRHWKAAHSAQSATPA